MVNLHLSKLFSCDNLSKDEPFGSSFFMPIGLCVRLPSGPIPSENTGDWRHNRILCASRSGPHLIDMLICVMSHLNRRASRCSIWHD